MTPEGQRPAQCPDRGQPHSDMGVQPLENKALSRGIIRKAACILIEITIRKSQRLNFMLFSEKNHVKALKNQRILTRPDHLNAFLELHVEDKPWPLRGRSLHNGDAL
jgi:hypothetical protein